MNLHFAALLHIFKVIIPCKYNNSHTWIGLIDFFHQCQSIHFCHLNICDHQIYRMCFHNFQGFQAGSRCINLSNPHLFPRKNTGNSISDNFFVIHNDNPIHDQPPFFVLSRHGRTISTRTPPSGRRK